MTIYINARFLTQKITGVQRYAMEMSKQLKKLYPEIKFVAPQNVIHKELAKSLETETYGNLTGHLWEQIELPQYMKKQRNPLLMNLANTGPVFYKKQIVTIHDLAFLRKPKWFSKRFYCYYKFFIPKIIERSVKVITVSEFSKQEIINLLNISSDKIEIIYGAISDDFVKKLEEGIYKKYEDYILAVSLLDPRKNFKNLILSFNKVNIDNIKLIIVSSKNKIFRTSSVDKLIGSNGKILFTGYISDKELISLYKNAKLFIYPSLYEGFGIPPLEAMACGCPVVVSNAASLPEVCGDAAYYVNPYDIDSIADGIYRVFTDENLRESLIQKGLQRTKMFSWEKSAKKYIKVFEEVLNS